MSLSLSIAGFHARGDEGPWAKGPKRAIEWVGSIGYRAVQLDAAAPGVRARELDRSARRDLAATLRRAELALSGLDLWIPGHHFLEAKHADRAVGAVVGALELAAELAGLVDGSTAVVCVELPRELGDGVRGALEAAALGQGAVLADHAWPLGEGPAGESVGEGGESGVRVGLNPAAVLLSGGDPVGAAGALGGRLASARVMDLSARGACVPGEREGKLDLEGYAAALAVGGRVAHPVFDPHGLHDVAGAAGVVLERWPGQLVL